MMHTIYNMVRANNVRDMPAKPIGFADDKKIAVKFAKEDGVTLTKETMQQKDPKFWKMLLKEMILERKVDMKYNRLVDEYKEQRAKIFHKRAINPVMKDVKSHERKRIQVTLNVIRSDPPTVTKESVSNVIDDINMYNYTVAFSVTVIRMQIDEGDPLQEYKETEYVTPLVDIKHHDFLKKYERRAAGALTGFFNSYMKKLVHSFGYVKQINLVLNKRVVQPKKLPKLKDGLNTNCLIKIVHGKMHIHKNYEKKIKPKLDELNEKYFEQGCDERAVDEICHAARINIHIVSILQETWYHKHIGDNYLTLLVCAHNQHATYLEDSRDMTNFLQPGNKGKINYVDDVKQCFLDDPAPIKFPMVVHDQIVAYFDFEGNLTKNRDIFFDVKDEKKNKSNDDLKNVFTLTSRYYHELKCKYDIQDRYRDENLYSFVKCADLYAPPWCSDEKYAELGIAHDQDRAYLMYERSAFYDQYQFPRMPTHFYKVDELKEGELDQLLKLTGFAEVKNVNIPMTKQMEYVRETQFIQDQGVYTTMRLAWLKSLGVTFELTKIAWSNDKQKLDFTIELTDWQCNVGQSRKELECQLMGRLIPNLNNTFTSLVHCKDENEFLQLRYQLGARVLTVDHENKITYYTNPPVDINDPSYQPNLKGAYHVHAYILDYQQIEFASKAMSVSFDDILKVKVDCMVLRKPSIEHLSGKLANKSQGIFTQTEILEWLKEHTERWKLDELKHFEGFHDVEVPTNDRPNWAGFHVEHNIKAAKTPLLSETDFTHRHHMSIKALAVIPRVDDKLIGFHKFIEITGDAGVGKTYTATNANLHDSCILVPNNALRLKFAKEHPNTPCATYHMAFHTNKKKGDYLEPRKPFSNYILDEASMICKGVFNQIMTHKNALQANFVIIHDRAQLAPVMPGNESWNNPADRYFTNGKEYQARNWHHIHLTKQHRQNDPMFIDILTKMRTLHDQKNQGLKEMIELLNGRIITEAKAVEYYRMDKDDIMIASTNNEVDRWNDKLNKIAKKGELKVKFTKEKGERVKNERLIMQDEVTKDQELAYACTVHIVQGLTFHDRLFVSLSLLQTNNNFDSHLLYTSVSRVKSIDQLYLVAVDSVTKPMGFVVARKGPPPPRGFGN